MSKTFTININCENEKTKEVVSSFFNEFKPNILPLLSALFKRDGEESDPDISVSPDGAIEVKQMATDKGLVLVASATEGKFAEVVDYSSITDGGTYLTKDQEKMAVFIKNTSGMDNRVGHFLELDAALRHLDSDEVKSQIKQLAERANEVEEDTVEEAVYVDEKGKEVK